MSEKFPGTLSGNEVGAEAPSEKEPENGAMSLPPRREEEVGAFDFNGEAPPMGIMAGAADTAG